MSFCAIRVMLILSVAFTVPLSAGAQILPPDEGLPVIDWQDAGKFVDRDVIVQGKIFETTKLRSICFLNFDGKRSFTAIIRSANYRNFPRSPDLAYAGKLVRIRGRISTYQGKPQIEVSKPDQISILEQLEPIPPTPEAPPQRATRTITLAAYNALNLFDEHDDPYREDEGTPPKPREQLEKLAATIRTLNADVLALEEIENRGYLEHFVRALLPDMGYEVVCFEGNDARGIDNAVLSRFPVGPVTSYRHLRFSDGSGGMTGFRRDLLRVEIRPPGAAPFDVFVVHFKSKGGSSNDGGVGARLRLAEATQARAVLDEVLREDAGARFVICGDFNDTWESAPLRALRGEGVRALRCYLEDLDPKTPSYNREPHRNVIDFILCSPAMAGLYVPKSYGIIAGSVNESGSDHNPVFLRFALGSEPDGPASAPAPP